MSLEASEFRRKADMTVFATKWFVKSFLKENDVPLARLMQAAEEIARGKIDADLGGGMIKPRIARANTGKSRGFRVIILFRFGQNLFFVDGFAKNVKANISDRDLVALRELAIRLFGLSADQLSAAVEAGELKIIGVENDFIEEKGGQSDSARRP